jgi:hypothetical protein
MGGPFEYRKFPSRYESLAIVQLSRSTTSLRICILSLQVRGAFLLHFTSRRVGTACSPINVAVCFLVYSFGTSDLGVVLRMILREIGLNGAGFVWHDMMLLLCFNHSYKDKRHRQSSLDEYASRLMVHTWSCSLPEMVLCNTCFVTWHSAMTPLIHQFMSVYPARAFVQLAFSVGHCCTPL